MPQLWGVRVCGAGWLAGWGLAAPEAGADDTGGVFGEPVGDAGVGCVGVGAMGAWCAATVLCGTTGAGGVGRLAESMAVGSSRNFKNRVDAETGCGTVSAVPV